MPYILDPLHAVFGRVVQYTTIDPTTTNLILPRIKKKEEQKRKFKKRYDKCAAAITYTQWLKLFII